jgi:hypothetical protein
MSALQGYPLKREPGIIYFDHQLADGSVLFAYLTFWPRKIGPVMVAFLTGPTEESIGGFFQYRVAENRWFGYFGYDAPEMSPPLDERQIPDVVRDVLRILLAQPRRKPRGAP